MPNQFFDKEKGQELKQNEQGQQKSRGFLECSICQLIGFYSEGQSFFLHGQDKDTDSFMWPPV